MAIRLVYSSICLMTFSLKSKAGKSRIRVTRVNTRWLNMLHDTDDVSISSITNGISFGLNGIFKEMV